jgi:hypothetical protein
MRSGCGWIKMRVQPQHGENCFNRETHKKDAKPLGFHNPSSSFPQKRCPSCPLTQQPKCFLQPAT